MGGMLMAVYAAVKVQVEAIVHLLYWIQPIQYFGWKGMNRKKSDRDSFPLNKNGPERCSEPSFSVLAGGIARRPLVTSN